MAATMRWAETAEAQWCALAILYRAFSLRRRPELGSGFFCKIGAGPHREMGQIGREQNGRAQIEEVGKCWFARAST